MTVTFILYVKNQEESKCFYEKLLQIKPRLHVKGMTEFLLSDTTVLGLMPENGISTIISPIMPHPKLAQGIPRCELYLKTKNVASYIERALQLNATLISPLQQRDWGDYVVYFADLDGHIIAFAE